MKKLTCGKSMVLKVIIGAVFAGFSAFMLIDAGYDCAIHDLANMAIDEVHNKKED